jgi:hypothetical protein
LLRPAKSAERASREATCWGATRHKAITISKDRNLAQGSALDRRTGAAEGFCIGGLTKLVPSQAIFVPKFWAGTFLEKIPDLG